MAKKYRFGAAYLGKSIEDARFNPSNRKRISGVSIPFANLEIQDNSISLKIFKSESLVEMNDIEKVFISKSGYTNIHSGANSFAFSHPDMRNIVKDLETRGVVIDKTNLKTASKFVYAQLIFVLVFFVFFIISFFLQ